MSKTIVNFVVDAVMFTVMLFLAATGALMHFVLPPGTGHFKTLWGMDRHDWGEVHYWIALTLIGLLAVHLFLHWRWIVSVVRGRSEKTATVRSIVAVVVVLALVCAAALPILGVVEEKNAEPPHRRQARDDSKPETHEINGSMTLQDVERATGVSAVVILKEMGLPPNTPSDERLGRLRRQHGFEMEAVRQAVQKQLAQQPRKNSP